MPQTGVLKHRTSAVCCTLRDSDQHQPNGAVYLGFCMLMCAHQSTTQNKCHHFHNHQGQCYAIPLLHFDEAERGKREYFNMAGGLYISLNHVFPDTRHYLCSSCFKLSCWRLLLQRLVDSQRRLLVRVANTHDQITLPQLGLHCRRKTNTSF